MTIKILVHFIGLEKKIQKSRNSQLILSSKNWRCCQMLLQSCSDQNNAGNQRHKTGPGNETSKLCIINVQHRTCIGSEMLLWHSNFKNVNLDSHLLPWKKKKPQNSAETLVNLHGFKIPTLTFIWLISLCDSFATVFFFNILKSNNKVRWHYYSWYFPSFSELSSSLGEG